MLTVGIVLMVLSVVAGVIAGASLALMSSGARATGGRVRTAMVPGGREQDAPYYPSERDVPPYGTEEPPGWVLKLALVSAGGLVLGLFVVMIGSMT